MGKGKATKFHRKRKAITMQKAQNASYQTIKITD